MDQENKRNKGGRKPKMNPSRNRYVFRLTDQENADFLKLFENAGTDNKAKFIVSLLFQRPLKTVVIDQAVMEYCLRLTTLFGQFRSVGVNYNQIVKLLYRNFSEKKAAAYLFKLEKHTVQLAALCSSIIAQTKELEEKYLKKEN